MPTNIVVPEDLWEENDEAVLTNWLVSDGATIEADTLVAEIMTAKVQYEIYAPTSGTVRISEEVDAVLMKGAVIGTIE